MDKAEQALGDLAEIIFQWNVMPPVEFARQIGGRIGRRIIFTNQADFPEFSADRRLTDSEVALINFAHFKKEFERVYPEFVRDVPPVAWRNL